MHFLSREMLTREVIRERFDYDPITGIVTYRINAGNRRIGDRAGTLHDTGYLRVNLGGKSYQLTHIIWLGMTGSWPIGQIDHCDRNRTHNAWSNLRDVDFSTNQLNRRSW